MYELLTFLLTDLTDEFHIEISEEIIITSKPKLTKKTLLDLVNLSSIYYENHNEDVKKIISK